MTTLDRPTYAPIVAARLVGLSTDRVRRWLHGYSRTYPIRSGEVRTSRKKPVVRRDGAESSTFASFLDVVDLLFVKRFLDYGIPLQRLRKALDEAASILHGHHFAQRSFFTDGRSIYLQIKSAPNADALLELLSNGQWVIAPVIRSVAHQIDFHDQSGLAERWFPLGRDKPVVIDPEIAFGAPSILGRGIKTANVYDFFRAEGEHLDSVSSWLKLSSLEVQAAVEFECQLAA